MKKLFTITESEREEILSKHKNRILQEQEQTAVGSAFNAFQAQRLQNRAQRQQSKAEESQAKANEFAGKLPQQPAAQQPAAQQPEAQPTTPQPTTPQQPEVQPRFKTATCAGLQKGPKCVDNLLKLQIKINDVCPPNVLKTKLVEDGIIGTNTKNAIAACDTYIKVTPQPGTQPQGGQPGTQPQASTTTGTQPQAGQPSSIEQIDSKGV